MKFSEKKCVPCQTGAEAFDRATSENSLKELKDWKLDENSKWLSKEFKFKNFVLALEFVNKVGAVAEVEQHHPNIDFTWGLVKISIQTHKINGLGENDFILAAKIDQL